MNPVRLKRRTVFDLTPSELGWLEKLDRGLRLARLEARRTQLPGNGFTGDADDYSIASRYVDATTGIAAKKVEDRKLWLKEKRISLRVAKQAKDARYNPFLYADALGLVAPPMPVGYEEELKRYLYGRNQNYLIVDPNSGQMYINDLD